MQQPTTSEELVRRCLIDLSDPLPRTESYKPHRCILACSEPIPKSERDTFFLVVTNKTQTGELSPQGLIRLLTDWRDGIRSLSAAAMLADHLHGIGYASRDEALAEETRRFAEQFRLPGPKQGLTGFLKKETQRFPMDPKTRAKLDRCLWVLHRLFPQNGATSPPS